MMTESAMQFDVIEFAKSIFRHILANGQTIRWVTQQPVLGGILQELQASGDWAIDVGCGGGTYAMELLAPRFERVVALDCEARFMRLTYARVRRKCLGHVHVVVASAEALPFRHKFANTLLCSEVLEHLTYDDRAVAEFARVLKPGIGLLVVSVPHPPEPFPNPEHVRPGYTEAEIRLLLEQAGFDIEKVKFCMYALTRFVMKIGGRIRLPLPLLFLSQIEHWLVQRGVVFSDPYDIVLAARSISQMEH
jgi:ubiquinone/menaquinone biosynthesis C-methylase UbiE